MVWSPKLIAVRGVEGGPGSDLDQSWSPIVGPSGAGVCRSRTVLQASVVSAEGKRGNSWEQLEIPFAEPNHKSCAAHCATVRTLCNNNCMVATFAMPLVDSSSLVFRRSNPSLLKSGKFHDVSGNVSLNAPHGCRCWPQNSERGGCTRDTRRDTRRDTTGTNHSTLKLWGPGPNHWRSNPVAFPKSVEFPWQRSIQRNIQRFNGRIGDIDKYMLLVIKPPSWNELFRLWNIDIAQTGTWEICVQHIEKVCEKIPNETIE